MFESSFLPAASAVQVLEFVVVAWSLAVAVTPLLALAQLAAAETETETVIL